MDFLTMIIAGNELFWIALIIIILLFGGRKIPEIARSLGMAKGEFEKGRLEGEKEAKSVKGEEDESEKLTKIAKELNIKTEGKSLAELKEEIRKALEK